MIEFETIAQLVFAGWVVTIIVVLGWYGWQ